VLAAPTVVREGQKSRAQGRAVAGRGLRVAPRALAALRGQTRRGSNACRVRAEPPISRDASEIPWDPPSRASLRARGREEARDPRKPGQWGIFTPAWLMVGRKPLER